MFFVFWGTCLYSCFCVALSFIILEVKHTFPVEILQEGFYLLITKAGGTLVLINFIFSLIFGLGSLVAGVLIFGPATLLLKDSFLLWFILPILVIIFAAVLIAFAIFVQFVILFCLMRIYEKKEPILSIEAFQNETACFKLYMETALQAAGRILMGLVMLITPGVQAFFKYFMVGPISIFEYSPQLQSAAILSKSERITEGHHGRLAYFCVAIVLLYILTRFILGSVFTQLFLTPVISTYFTICVVIYYKKLLKE